MTSHRPDLTDLSLERLRRRQSVKWTTHSDDVVPAFVAEMDFPLARPVSDALIEAIQLGDTGYANPAESGLAEAFAGFAARRFSWDVDPGQVVATSDVVGGLLALLKLTVQPGEKVIVTPPVYYPFFSIVPEAGAEVLEVPLTPEGDLDLPGIEQAFAGGAKAMILCSPHNPVGSVPSRVDLTRLAEIATKYDAWILADEIHAPLTLPGAVHTPFLDVSEEARECGICVTSASKAFNIAGLSCALIATASDRAADLVAQLPVGATHPGHLGVIAGKAAFEYGDEWLDQVIEQLDFNRTFLAELLERHLPTAIYRPPSASYLAWINASRLDFGPDPAEKILERARIAVSSGPSFGTNGIGYFRLNVGTSPNLIEAVVRSIAEAA